MGLEPQPDKSKINKLLILLGMAVIIIAGLSYLLIKTLQEPKIATVDASPSNMDKDPQNLGRKWFKEQIKLAADNRILEWDKHYNKDETFIKVKRTFEVKEISEEDIKKINKGFSAKVPDTAKFLRATIHGKPGWFGKKGEFYDFYVIRKSGVWKIPSDARLAILEPSGLLN